MLRFHFSVLFSISFMPYLGSYDENVFAVPLKLSSMHQFFFSAVAFEWNWPQPIFACVCSLYAQFKIHHRQIFNSTQRRFEWHCETPELIYFWPIEQFTVYISHIWWKTVDRRTTNNSEKTHLYTRIVWVTPLENNYAFRIGDVHQFFMRKTFIHKLTKDILHRLLFVRVVSATRQAAQPEMNRHISFSYSSNSELACVTDGHRHPCQCACTAHSRWDTCGNLWQHRSTVMAWLQAYCAPIWRQHLHWLSFKL